MTSSEMLDNVVRYLQSLGLTDEEIERIKRLGTLCDYDLPTMPCASPPEVA